MSKADLSFRGIMFRYAQMRWHVRLSVHAAFDERPAFGGPGRITHTENPEPNIGRIPVPASTVSAGRTTKVPHLQRLSEGDSSDQARASSCSTS